MIACRGRGWLRTVTVGGTAILVAGFAAPAHALPDWLQDPSYGDPVDLSERRSLHISLTLAREEMTVAELLAWLEDEYDLRLRAEPAALQKRLAIFVTERPAWEVLEAVAGALYGEWRLHLTNLWLRLSHAPDDIEGYERSWDWSLEDPAFHSIETGSLERTTADHAIAAWAATLTPDAAAALFSDNGLEVEALPAASQAAFLEALRAWAAQPALRLFREHTAELDSTYLSRPDASYAFWLEWNDGEFRYTELLLLPGGVGGGGTGGRFDVSATLPNLPPGAGAGPVMTRAREAWRRENDMDADEDEAWARWHRDREVLIGLCQERGYLPEDFGGRQTRFRRPPGVSLTRIALGGWSGLSHLLHDELRADLEQQAPTVQAGRSVAAVAQQLAVEAGFSIVAALPDPRATPVELEGPAPLYERLLALGRALHGHWYAHGPLVYFAPHPPPQPLLALVEAWAAMREELLPTTWRHAARQLPADDSSDEPGQRAMSFWSRLVPLLTDREREILARDVLFWQDLQPWQRETLLRDIWEVFLWRVARPLPEELQDRLEVLREATACTGRLTIHDIGRRVELRFEGTPVSDTFTLAPGIQVHLLDLRRQADAAKPDS